MLFFLILDIFIKISGWFYFGGAMTQKETMKDLIKERVHSFVIH